MRTRLLRLAVVYVAVTLTSLTPRFAAGSEPVRDSSAAEALFAEAQGLMARGDYRTACPKLEESYRLDPATGALFALAYCHEQVGLYASAWSEFMDVASRANAERYPEREQTARERAAAIHPKLSFLTVRVDAKTAALPELVIARDGVRLGAAAWNTALPIDPGRHVIQASAPGCEPWQGAIVIGSEPQRESIGVPELVPLRAAVDAGTKTVPPTKTDDEGLVITPLRAVAIGLGGAALMAFGVATYASVRAIQKNNESEKNDNCNENNECNAEGERDRASAQEAATFASVSAVAGGVLLASGVVLFVIGAPDDHAPKVGVTASPFGASFELSGRF